LREKLCFERKKVVEHDLELPVVAFEFDLAALQ